jgi:hypothetical protein
MANNKLPPNSRVCKGKTGFKGVRGEGRKLSTEISLPDIMKGTSFFGL